MDFRSLSLAPSAMEDERPAYELALQCSSNGLNVPPVHELNVVGDETAGLLALARALEAGQCQVTSLSVCGKLRQFVAGGRLALLGQRVLCTRGACMIRNTSASCGRLGCDRSFY